MAIKEIIKYPDDILRKTALEITNFDKVTADLAHDMTETMYHNQGIGLAGNQIGILKRILVLDVSEKQDNPIHFINPQIISKRDKTSSTEGCLSIPDYRETITRSKEITIKAQNISGETFELEADGLLAICLQHEIDHLDGVLFIDHMSFIKKQLFKRWLNKHSS